MTYQAPRNFDSLDFGVIPVDEPIASTPSPQAVVTTREVITTREENPETELKEAINVFLNGFVGLMLAISLIFMMASPVISLAILGSILTGFSLKTLQNRT
jgi:hypothetical protein